MAIAFVPSPTPEGSKVHKLHQELALYGELVFTGSYVTGGEVITAPAFKTLLKQIGDGKIYFVLFGGRLGYTFDYDYAADKVMVRQDAAAGAPSAELAAAGYPAGLTGLAAGNRVRVMVIGR
jgi:hypothetical protein